MARKLKNWLKSYKEYTSQQESPELFHMWVGLSCLSAALRRQFSIHQGYFTIYPNLYVVISAIPGKQKKSTAMDIGREILQNVPGVSISANKLTTESLINMLALASVSGATATGPGSGSGGTFSFGDSTTTIWSSELAVMMSRDSYKSGLITLLTDLYNCPDKWRYTTLTRGEELMTNVCLTLIGAVTPDVLKSSFNPDIIGSGFPSRLVLVATDQMGPLNPRPRLTPQMQRLRDDLINDLIYISTLKGSLDFEPDAADYFDNWYKTERLDIPQNLSDKRFSGYLERRHVQLLKLVTCVGVAFEDINKIKLRHLGIAKEILDAVEATMHLPFQGDGDSPNKSHVARILDQIVAAGGRLYIRDFVRLNLPHISDMDHMVKVTKLMEAGGLIKTVKEPGGTYYELHPDEVKTSPALPGPSQEAEDDPKLIGDSLPATINGSTPSGNGATATEITTAPTPPAGSGPRNNSR